MDPQPRNTFNVAVIGAGLSGLCLAQSLKKSGIDVHVYERDDSAETRGQGYRITLDERGIRALEVCLPDSLFALFEATSGAPGGFFRFTRRDLREIFRLTFTASRAQSRYLPRQADRSTLRQILLCGLEDQVSFGKQCTRVEATALGATAHFADGTSAAFWSARTGPARRSGRRSCRMLSRSRSGTVRSMEGRISTQQIIH